MKHILPFLTVAMLLAACTQDELTDNTMLPEGMYPLEIASVTLSVEGGEAQPWGAKAPQTRVSENTYGTGSLFMPNDAITVSLGGETAAYTYDGNAWTSTAPLYWQNTETATVNAWYPTAENVSLADQSEGLAYVLKGSGEGSYQTGVNLTFTHQLAKVRVVLTGEKASDVTQVEINNYKQCTHTQGEVQATDADKGYIAMRNLGNDVWEANVVPGTITPSNFIRLNGSSEATASGITDLAAGAMYTVNLNVKSPVIPDDAKDITGSINDDGNYVVSGTRNEAITITGGSPHIYLDDAQISVSSGPAINITGGTPTIHVVGTGNSVTSGNDTGIAVSGGATVTITGNSTADVLTANGGTSGGYSGSDTAGAGIGSPVGGTQGGNVIIRNVTVNATGGAISIRGGGAGIGSSSNGTLGNITIENAVINATGGYMSAAIGMGCNHYNDQSPAPSIGAITITNSDVTATAGRGAAAIGFSYSMTIMGSSTYCSGKITITTDNLDTFLSHLSLNQATTTNYTLAQRIGKGQQMSNYPSTFRNTDNTGSWEGVVINDTAYPDGYE